MGPMDGGLGLQGRGQGKTEEEAEDLERSTR